MGNALWRRASARLVVFALAAALTLGSGQAAPPVNAAAAIKVFVSGQELPMDVPPLLEKGSVLVPMRAIFEALGAQVDYLEETGTIAAHRWNCVIVLRIGETLATVRDIGNTATIRIVQQDQPPKVVSGRVLVPIRFVSENLAATVDWLAESREVRIAPGGAKPSYLVPDSYYQQIVDLYRSERTWVNVRAKWNMTRFDYANDVGVAVVDGSKTTWLDGKTPDSAGQIWVCLKVQMHNRGGATTFVTPLQFTLLSIDGMAASVNAETYAYSDRLPGIDLPSGTRTEGWIIFSIKEAGPFTLLCEVDGKSVRKAIRLDLLPPQTWTTPDESSM